MSEELNEANLERDHLKKVVEALCAEKDALNETLYSILNANINLKAGAAILERRIKLLNDELAESKKELDAVKEELSSIKQQLEVKVA